MVVAGAAPTSADAFDAPNPANASAAQAAHRPLPHVAGRPENGMTRLPESVQNPGRRTALPSVSPLWAPSRAVANRSALPQLNLPNSSRPWRRTKRAELTETTGALDMLEQIVVRRQREELRVVVRQRHLLEQHARLLRAALLLEPLVVADLAADLLELLGL